MAPERIVIVNDSSTVAGGATKVARSCIEVAVEAGYDVGVLVGDDGGDLSERFPSIALRRLNQRPLREFVTPRDIPRKLYNRTAAAELRRLIDWAGSDATVHVHSWSQILSPSVFRVLAEHPGRVIVTAHDFFLICPNGGFIDYPRGEICTLTPLGLSCISTNCDKRNYYHKLWRSCRQAIQNVVGRPLWLRLELILVYEEMERFLAPFQTGRRRTVRNYVAPYLATPGEPWSKSDLIFLGRMTPEKGVDTLIEALDRSKTPATLIGKGPLLEEAQARLPHCRVLGWVDDPELERIFREARAVIFPSKMPEPYGLVAAEAITSGLPVIVSDSALIANELVKNRVGISFRSGDVKSLISAIEQSRDDDLLKELALNARRYAPKIALSREDWQRTMISIYSGNDT